MLAACPTVNLSGVPGGQARKAPREGGLRGNFSPGPVPDRPAKDGVPVESPPELPGRGVDLFDRLRHVDPDERRLITRGASPPTGWPEGRPHRGHEQLGQNRGQSFIGFCVADRLFKGKQQGFRILMGCRFTFSAYVVHTLSPHDLSWRVGE